MFKTNNWPKPILELLLVGVTFDDPSHPQLLILRIEFIIGREIQIIRVFQYLAGYNCSVSVCSQFASFFAILYNIVFRGAMKKNCKKCLVGGEKKFNLAVTRLNEYILRPLNRLEEL